MVNSNTNTDTPHDAYKEWGDAATGLSEYLVSVEYEVTDKYRRAITHLGSALVALQAGHIEDMQAILGYFDAVMEDE